MLTKDNVTIGVEWRFGAEWPGQRCGAKTRKGTACQRPANKRNGRCRVHGGASTGPRTEEGRARISEANLRHGRYTKDKLEKRRENADKGHKIRAEIKHIEKCLIEQGVLDRNSSLENISKRSGFVPERPIIEIHGRCGDCGNA